MYIGDIDDGLGLYYMVYEVVDNGIDEVLVGYVDFVFVKIYVDSLVLIMDNGCGILVDMYFEEGIFVVEVIMIQLYVGGKFDQNLYKVFGGLYGVGILVVNVLFDWFELCIWCNDKEYYVCFERGVFVVLFEVVGDVNGCKGIEVCFFVFLWIMDLIGIFLNFEYSYEMLEKCLCELVFLNLGVWIILLDECFVELLLNELFYDGGVKEFVKYFDWLKYLLMLEFVYVMGEKDGIGVEVVMWWNDSYYENVLLFINNILQWDGGMYMVGFCVVLIWMLMKYVQEYGIGKKEKVFFIGDDVCEGLICVLLVKVFDFKFSSQMKDKLVSFEVCLVVENLMNEKLVEWFEENLNIVKSIVLKIIEVVMVCEVVCKVCELICCKMVMDVNFFVGKFKDCFEKDFFKIEVFFVEGDLVGGLV